MNIFFNSKAIETENDALLITVLQANDIASKKGIAVAVNNTVVKREDWKSCILSENDKVIVISATKGG